MIDISKSLGNIEPGLPRALLIRHAEREPIPDLRDGYHTPLTDGGRAQVRRFGRRLAPWSPITLVHSPVPRCRDTASRIAAGVEEAGGNARLQGEDPGLLAPYVLDPERAMELAATLRTRFLRAWFEGELPPGVLHDPHHGAHLQLQALTRRLTPDLRGLLVAVSHDWNIMLVREVFFRLRHEDVGWLHYLDGLTLVREPGGIRLIHGEHVRTGIG